MKGDIAFSQFFANQFTPVTCARIRFAAHDGYPDFFFTGRYQPLQTLFKKIFLFQHVVPYFSVAVITGAVVGKSAQSVP
jgi:hypothetical protein